MITTTEIADWLRSRPGRVRVAGTGSQVDTLPPKSDATKLDLSERNQIIRLDPGDQTCTVEGGVLRSQLDAALAEHDLELPCLGSGTIAGIFASDPFGPAGPGSIGPRNLLLGIDAMLADGTTFKSGAPVVKSVAGFDVHKLFVGSRGRLFLAMQMHLRLKPRPRSEQWFANRLLTMDEAIALLHALRDEAQPPTTLQLRRERDGKFIVYGRVTGRATHTKSLCKRHALATCEPITSFSLAADLASGEEVIAGNVLPSQLQKLLSSTPPQAPFTWLAGGRFETATSSPEASDALLQTLSETRVPAMVFVGAEHRRCIGTSLDAGEQQLADGLKKALDPDDILV